MNIDEGTQTDVHVVGDIKTPSCVGLTSNTSSSDQSAFIAACSQTGVSTRNALSVTTIKPAEEFHWYALRATYGRELKAYNYLISKGVVAFCPTVAIVKEFKGKRRTLMVSRLPNIFFAYGTEEQIKYFVYDNINLPYLRFYYQHISSDNKMKKIPLVVPEAQMRSLKIICEAEANDLIISSTTISKFETGLLVRVIDGPFKGVIGKVARYQVITAKRKASGFKNEKRFSTQKTKCDLKKHFKAQKRHLTRNQMPFYVIHSNRI